MDIEFLVQMLQLTHAQAQPAVLTPGTLLALDKLSSNGFLPPELAQELAEHYKLLRRFESGIRLMNMSARHELPNDEMQLQRLAFLLRGKLTAEPVGSQDAAKIAAQVEQIQRRCRTIFDQVFDNAMQAGA